jgi:hypothetical protein
MSYNYLAERVGFEPTIRCRIPDFESGAFGHSATSPRGAHCIKAASTLSFARRGGSQQFPP